MKTKINVTKGIQKGITKKNRSFSSFDSALINLGIKITPYSEMEKNCSK